MKVLGAKKLIITIMVLFITLTFSALLLNLANIIKNNKIESTTETLNVYAWSGEGTLSSPYEIWNLADLQNLETLVNMGVSFAGNYFDLKSSINCGNAQVVIGGALSEKNDYNGLIFSGNFNGNGYTISNMTATLGALNVGFFLNNSGTIQNTRFYNFKFTLPQDLGGAKNMGVIAGVNNGIIENCVVENCSFVTQRYKNNCNIASITGTNNGTIINCMIIGSFNVHSYSKNIIGNSDGAMVYPFACANNSAISRCVLNVSYSETGEDTSMITEDFTAPSTCYTSISSNYSELGNDLAQGGSSVSGQAWYFSSDYTDWPMLRSYMSWKTVSITAINGIVSPTSIEIPSDATNTYQSTSNTIQIYGQTIDATPSRGYDLPQWTCNNVTSYTVEFFQKFFYIEFGKIEDYSPSCETFEESTNKIKIFTVDEVELECKYSSDKTIVSYKIGNHTVTYELDSRYTMTSTDYGTIRINTGYEDLTVDIIDIPKWYSSMRNEGTYQLNPTMSLKTYNVTFG